MQQHSDPLPDIPTARAWWAAHSQRVTAALPLTLGSHCYTQRYAQLLTARLEAAEGWPSHLAEAEILRDLRQVRAAVLAQGTARVDNGYGVGL